MLGMIRNSLFGSVETWPWQVLSKGDKVGPQGCRGLEEGRIQGILRDFRVRSVCFHGRGPLWSSTREREVRGPRALQWVLGHCWGWGWGEEWKEVGPQHGELDSTC